MRNKEISIDFEIIWKKIHTSLSREEEEIFNSWLEEDTRHREYFKQATRYYSDGSGFDLSSVRIQDSWKKIAFRINSHKRQKRIRRIVYASSLAASIVILSGLFLWTQERPESEVSSVLENSIEPGKKKAILILDDGSVYDLSKEEDLSIEDGGTLINSKGDALEYLKQPEDPVEMKYNTLSIPRGGEFFLTLSDGTKVWLNSETRLKYPVQFPSVNRRVELTGEAYFEVQKDEKRPFQVITGEQTLEVLGTSFNLSSYPDDEIIYTTLVKGEVNVYLNAHPEISQKLSPSGQSRFQKGTLNISHHYVEVDEFVAWKDGYFSFGSQDLSEMMKTVSRWYDLDVRFENPEAMNIQFTGQVKRYENFEKILALIEKTNEVRFEINGNSVLIR